jgi:hypothetical protein
MTAIDYVKELMTGKFSDGTSKLSVYIDDTNVTEMNCIRLFYNGQGGLVSLTQSNAEYYKTGIQIAVRHNDNLKSRDLSFKIRQYINANRKTKAGYWWIPDSVPLFAGVDSIGGYVWTFDIFTKGGN